MDQLALELAMFWHSVDSVSMRKHTFKPDYGSIWEIVFYLLFLLDLRVRYVCVAVAPLLPLIS